MRGLRALVLVAVAFVAVTWPGAVYAQGAVMADLQAHLDAMKITTTKAGTDAVEFSAGFDAAKSRKFFARLDAKANFLYLAIVDLPKLDAKDPKWCDRAKTILRLNYGLALSKLEWDESTGELRLSRSVATEKGIGRDELNAMIQDLLASVEAVEARLAAN
ncbi:MAG: hypothetical protein KJ042_03655 [Deltaproteobacteria bacterium]|nr:hypothetical protein [Deltaproteobacteria bacterium]